MEIKVDIVQLRNLVFQLAVAPSDSDMYTALNYLREQVLTEESKLIKHLVNYYAMDVEKAAEHVEKALKAGLLFRVLQREDGWCAPMYLNSKRSPDASQIGEAAKESATHAKDGTIWCADRQLMCAGLIRNGWVYVGEYSD